MEILSSGTSPAFRFAVPSLPKRFRVLLHGHRTPAEIATGRVGSRTLFWLLTGDFLIRVVVYKFASASCREAFGTSRPGSGLLPPNPTLPAIPNFVTDLPPPCGTPPLSLGGAANRCRGSSRLSAAPTEGALQNARPSTLNFLQPLLELAPTPPLRRGPETLFPVFLPWGQPDCRGGARKRLHAIT